MSTPTAAPGGFIRFPRAWMALPISPAAKCLLMHFCGAADADGASWYSYAQLAALIGRSRASIAGYVAELRDARVIETERQRTANGFNYRLRISIVGWRAIVEDWRRTTSKARSSTERRQTERRVQPVERKNPSGSETEIHQTHAQPATAQSGPSSPVFCESHERDWRRCHDHDGDIRFSRPPSDRLLHAVIDHARSLERHSGAFDPGSGLAAARAALTTFSTRHRLVAPSDDIAALAPILARRAPTRQALDRALAALSAAWPAHWRKLSSPAQLDRWLTAWLGAQPDLARELSTLWRFRNRALRAEAELRRRRGASGFPAGNPDHGICAAA
jgi:hypothetical protein